MDARLMMSTIKLLKKCFKLVHAMTLECCEFSFTIWFLFCPTRIQFIYSHYNTTNVDFCEPQTKGIRLTFSLSPNNIRGTFAVPLSNYSHVRRTKIYCRSTTFFPISIHHELGKKKKVYEKSFFRLGVFLSY